LPADQAGVPGASTSGMMPIRNALAIKQPILAQN
jgi:hypothetical protein